MQRLGNAQVVALQRAGLDYQGRSRAGHCERRGLSRDGQAHAGGDDRRRPVYLFRLKAPARPKTYSYEGDWQRPDGVERCGGALIQDAPGKLEGVLEQATAPSRKKPSRWWGSKG